MSTTTNKKRIFAIVLLVILIILISLFIVWKNKKAKGPTDEQKVELIKKINEDAAKAPQLPVEQKEMLIKTMNQGTKDISPDQKKSLLDKFNQ